MAGRKSEPDEELQHLFGPKARARVPAKLLQQGWRGDVIETLSFRVGEAYLYSYGSLYLGCLDAAKAGLSSQWRKAAIAAGLTDEREADRLMCSAEAGAMAKGRWEHPFPIEAAKAFGADTLASYAGMMLAAGGYPKDLAEAAVASKKGLAGIAEQVNLYMAPPPSAKKPASDGNAKFVEAVYPLNKEAVEAH